jgi:DNA-binding MarR family transcriptional regulator
MEPRPVQKAKGAQPKRLENQLCFALYAASRAMTNAYRPVLGKFKLTYPQYIVMLVLWERDGLTLGELGSRLYLDSGTLSPLLKRLQAAGHIHRARSAKDERDLVITLTAKGRALRDALAGDLADLSCRIGMPEERSRALREEVKGVAELVMAAAR